MIIKYYILDSGLRSVDQSMERCLTDKF